MQAEALPDNFDHRHDATVFVHQNVAKVDELAGDVLEAVMDLDFAKCRHNDCIEQARCIDCFIIDRGYLELIDVDVKRVNLLNHILDRPLLHRPKLHGLVDDVRVEWGVVDQLVKGKRCR